MRPAINLTLYLLIFSLHSSLLAELEKRTIDVGGTEREYMIHTPEKAEDPPALVFGFHGHGGRMRSAARSFRLHEIWPEAIVIYMQGLNTPGKLTDPEGKRPGWQSGAGEQGDRDLKFFDAVYESLEGKFDPKNVFAMGHSNGGGFTYFLWGERGDKFTAMAPSSAANGKVRGKLKPKPVLHVAGKEDPLVKFAWQKRMIGELLKLNGCSSEYKPWHEVEGMETRLYSSPDEGPPVVVVLFSKGGHKFPAEAPELMVKFFKEQEK